MVSEPINVQRSVAVLIMMYNVQWWVKEEVMDKPCPGEDIGNDFPEEGMFAVHFHTASEEFCCSSRECRRCVCVGSEDGWGGRAGSETGKWAGAQPEEPLMYKKVFRLFLK